MKPSRKIIVMSMVPLVGLFLFLAYIIAGQIDIVRRTVSLRQLCEFAIKTGALVHELQAERGKTVGFLSGKKTILLPKQQKNEGRQRRRAAKKLLANEYEWLENDTIKQT